MCPIVAAVKDAVERPPRPVYLAGASTRDPESSRGFRRTHAETPGVLTGWL
jgi:hypothetical protein